MAFSRYARTQIIDYGAQYGTGRAQETIRRAIFDGVLAFNELTLHEAQRLDHIAAQAYGNGRYWWVIAAASDIGWALQVPAGTYLRIPDLESVAKLVG